MKFICIASRTGVCDNAQRARVYMHCYMHARSRAAVPPTKEKGAHFLSFAASRAMPATWARCCREQPGQSPPSPPPSAPMKHHLHVCAHTSSTLRLHACKRPLLRYKQDSVCLFCHSHRALSALFATLCRIMSKTCQARCSRTSLGAHNEIV